MKLVKILFFIAVLLISILIFGLNVYAFSIPDTGQTKCYNNTDEIPLPQSGEPFYGQDAQYVGPTRSYTKLGQNGAVLADSATRENGWLMTLDNVTGLIWEMKTDDSGIHDMDNTYTWCDTNPATNGGNQGTCGNGTDTEDFINALNAANYGGFSDWRLPTIKELSYLINSSIPYPGPTVDASWFPNTAVSTKYWSSTTDASYSLGAWPVSFDFGRPDHGFLKSNSYHVRAVRGDSSSVLVDNGDGTVTDTITGLMWQKVTAPGAYTWQSALYYCENLTLAGHSDWRLPNRNELQSLVDYSHSSPAIDPLLASNTELSFYWSSTTRTGSTNYAWVVSGGQGVVNYYGKTNNYYVRAVRLGLSGSLGNLAISKSGSGEGTVSSAPAGINCGSQCSSTFTHGTQVTLTATPNPGSTFTGWTGAFIGTQTTCQLMIDSDKAVTATFNDITPPVGTIAVNGGASWANALSVTLNIICTDAGGCAQMSFSNDNNTWSEVEVYGTTKSWNLLSGDGTKTVYAKFRDTEGNWSGAFSDTIILDTTAPVTTPSSSGGTLSGAQSIALTAEEGSSIYYTIDGSDPKTSATRIQYTAPIPVTASTTLKYYAVDSAGNPEEVKTEIYTITYTLTVTKDGTGTGTVSSIPEGISCGEDCSEPYIAGTLVVLTAAPDSRSSFTGWSGICSWIGDCWIIMNQSENVITTFSLKGDIDTDSAVTLADAIIALQVLTGITPISTIDKGADVNIDRMIGLAEAIYILQTIAGVRNITEHGIVLFSDNFDSATAGQVPSGWAAVHDGDGQCVVTPNQSYSSPNSFRIGSLSSWDGVYTHPVTMSGNIIIVSIRFKGDPNTWFRPYFDFTIANKTYGGSYDPTSGEISWICNSPASSSVSKNIWYTVQIQVDKTTGLASYYLNGNAVASGCQGDKPFPTRPDENVTLASGNGGNGIIYYDDISVIGY